MGRAFGWRGTDLRSAAGDPPGTEEKGPFVVSRASLKADLAATHERVGRQAAHIRQLDEELDDLLGERVGARSGPTFNRAMNSSRSGCFVR